MWRNDSRCGSEFPLPNGTAAECNPDGHKTCCSEIGHCGNSTVHCFCSKCKDYKVRKLESEENYSIIKTETGFLKRMYFDENRNRMLYQCIYSDNEYYEPDYDYDLRLNSATEVCSNDPHGYQACGFNTEITNTDVLCGGYICDKRVGDEHRYVKCAGEDCKTKNKNCRASRADTYGPLICDDRCDKDLCKDESFCNGYQYGVNCTWWRGEGVPADLICNGVDSCVNREDEKDCTVSNKTVHTCSHYLKKVLGEIKTVPIFNNTRCSVFDISKGRYPYCTNYLDQTNCSDVQRIGGYCKIKGYWSNISKYMVCYEYDQRTNLPIKLCDDDLQNRCLTLPKTNCKIHKHRMCDGVEDCPGGTDETDVMCESMSDEFNFNCNRSFQPKISNYKIPISWIMDNETDCINGQDENESMWKFCSGSFIPKQLSDKNCPKVFKCPEGEKSHVHLAFLCNSIETCDTVNNRENRLCAISRDFLEIDRKAPFNRTVRSVCDDKISSCEVKQFRRPWGDVFGDSKIELYVPDSKTSCSGLFGEHYLYLSCMDLCTEEDIECPLHGEMRILKHDSCPGQLPDRAYTLGNNSFLTFVVESESGRYQQDYYLCNNSRCIEYGKVCDLIDDCGDMSDELDCKNHMICENTLKKPTHQFIPLSQKCDGIYDCFDLSDECNSSCERFILGNRILKTICWTTGILAIVFNSTTLIRGLSSLKTCRTDSMMISKVLISLIGSGDFLIGLYLVILSVYDSIIYGDSYCKAQPEWLTGVPCVILGVISTVGSQVSLFSMTAISCIRLHGLRSMRIPQPANTKSKSKVILLAIAIIVASFAIAVIPLVDSFEDYFVQGIYYDPAYKLFIGFPNKERHIKILRSYYDNTTKITSDLSWKEIGEKVDGMFDQGYGTLTRSPVHFYGNDGVCLFKYFIRTDDARRSRESLGAKVMMNDPVVWTMLAVNLICFLIMTGCYIGIIVNTKHSTKTSGQHDNPDRLKEDRAMHMRVMIIIVTDFLCWVPFIIICALHNVGRIDGTSWYVFFAMTVLPLNSVINPIIYDRALQKVIMKNLVKIKTRISNVISSIVGTFMRIFRNRDQNNHPEVIPMKILNVEDKND